MVSRLLKPRTRIRRGPTPTFRTRRPEGHTFARRGWSVSKPGLPPHPVNPPARATRMH